MGQNSPLRPVKHVVKHIPLNIVFKFLYVNLTAAHNSFKIFVHVVAMDTLRSYQGTPLHAL